MLTEIGLATSRQQRPPFILSSCLGAFSKLPKVSKRLLNYFKLLYDLRLI